MLPTPMIPPFDRLGKLKLTVEEEQMLRRIPLGTFKRMSSVLIHAINENQVVAEVYSNLKKLRADFKECHLLSVLTELVHQQNLRQMILLREVSRIFKILHPLAGHILCIKGIALSQFYPDTISRWMSDIDLYVDNASNFWRSLKLLHRSEYQVQRVKIFRCPNEVSTRDILPICGSTVLTSKRTGISMDLHFGAYHVCGEQHLKANLLEKALYIRLGSSSVLCPAAENYLLITLSHMLNHGRLTMRDINDANVIINKAGNHFDWDYFVSQVRDNALELVAQCLLSEVNRYYEDVVPSGVISKMRFGAFPRMFTLLRYRNSVFIRKYIPLFIQFIYFSQIYNSRDYLRFTVPLKAIKTTYYLWKTGRGYQIWDLRQMRSLRQGSPVIVIVPICRNMQAEGRIKEIAQEVLMARAQDLNVATEVMEGSTVIWNAGHSQEMIFTPAGLFTQSGYHGQLSDIVRHSIELQAIELLNTWLDKA